MVTKIWSLIYEFDNGQSKVGIFFILRLKNLTKIDDQIWLPLSMSRFWISMLRLWLVDGDKNWVAPFKFIALEND
jgi:hypothetical protein